MMHADALTIEEVQALRLELQPHLEKASSADLGIWTPNRALLEAEKDQILIWAIRSGDDPKILAVCGTQLRMEERPPVMEVLFLGGEGFKDWGQVFETAEQYAEMNGCRLRFEGRKGWKRLLPQMKVVEEIGGLFVYEKDSGHELRQ